MTLPSLGTKWSTSQGYKEQTEEDPNKMLKRCHRSKTVQGIWSVKNYWTWQFLGMTWGLALEFMNFLFLNLSYRLKQKVTREDRNKLAGSTIGERFQWGWANQWLHLENLSNLLISDQVVLFIEGRMNDRLKVSPAHVLHCVRFFAAPWAVAHQATLPMEWGTISYSRGSSWPRDGTRVSCVSYFGRWILYH